MGTLSLAPFEEDFAPFEPLTDTTTLAKTRVAAFLNSNPLNKALGDELDPHQSTRSKKSRFDQELAARLPLRILLAEDNPVNQHLALRLLKRMGYQADVVSNGVEAIEAIRRQPYDLIFMDLRMPHLDGLAATKRIIAQWAKAERPWIIAMTADATQSDRRKCLDAGMDDYIAKPIEIEALVAALKRAYAHKSSCDENIQLAQDIRTEAQLSQPGGATAQGIYEESLVIDPLVLGRLRDMFGEKADHFITKMIRLFSEESQKRLSDLETAIHQNNSEQIALGAHTLKGSCGVIGAIRMAKICKELECASRAQNTEQASQLLDQIRVEYRQVESVLNQLFKDPS